MSVKSFRSWSAFFAVFVSISAQAVTNADCVKLMHVGDAARVASGERTYGYYSGFGSSYGKNPMAQLDGYLEIGARLSPRGWALFKELRAGLPSSIEDRRISRAIVEYLHPSTLTVQGKIASLVRELGSTWAADRIAAEISAIEKDVAIFKKNVSDFFAILAKNDGYVQTHRGDPAFRAAKREADGFKREKTFGRYRYVFETLFRERWNDSFVGLPEAQIASLRDELKFLRSSPPYERLSEHARKILELQLERETAGKFYTNYGGLYNRKDLSFVWYASGEDQYSRESFRSIQGYFAQDGLTFEFKPEAQKRVSWDAKISLDRKYEPSRNDYQGFTSDVVSMSGNLIPEDVSRVYVSTPERLSEVKARFEKALGKRKLDESGITFHLVSEQAGIHAEETEKAISTVLGTPAAPRVSAVVAGKSTYFLGESEIREIQAGKRPLKHLLRIDYQEGTTPIEALLKRHTGVELSATFSKSEIFSGGFDASGVYLDPAMEALAKPRGRSFYVEFRPEVSRKQIDDWLRSGFRDGFQFSMISRIYCPNDTEFRVGEKFLLDYLGLQNLFKWDDILDVNPNLGRNYRSDAEEFAYSLAHPKTRALNLDQAEIFTALYVTDLPRGFNLFHGETEAKVRKFLLSSENFGIEPSRRMKDVLEPSEYEVWEKLQDLVIRKAKVRTPLSMEVIDEILLLAAQSSKRHAPAGYREIAKTHEIWPGGKKLGKHWIFPVSEAQHYFREASFALPSEVYRSSPGTLVVDRLSYRIPGGIRDQVVVLLDKYNRVKTERGPIIAASLFYKDLVTLHPLTDGNGRGSRAILAYLLLSEGVAPASFELASSADIYLTGDDFIRFIEMGIYRGNESILGDRSWRVH